MVTAAHAVSRITDHRAIHSGPQRPSVLTDAAQVPPAELADLLALHSLLALTITDAAKVLM